MKSLKKVTTIEDTNQLMHRNRKEDFEFELFGSNWKVKFTDLVYDEEDNWLYGSTDPKTNEIKISTKFEDGRPIPGNELNITVLHELFHVILQTGQYSDDEPLVEFLARSMFSLIKQDVINL